MADEFKLDDAPAGMGNLGPVPPGVAAPGQKRKYTRRTTGERTPRRATRTNPKQIYGIIGMGVAGGNKVGNLNPWWKESGFLRPDEVTALSVALGDEALSHKQLIKWIEQAGENMVHIKLATVLLAIAVPRLAMLGMLPPELIDVFSIMVEQGKAAEAERDTETQPKPERGDSSAFRDRTGGAHEFHGSNGERKVNGARSRPQPSSAEPFEATEPETVQDTAPVEAG